ncbi:MAG TPA: HAD hydrolase family protein [Candidatus Gastranaerophilaceae bacterium]|nr:HAD hydrolase family protein [Candidatus Gastranaerophilaceae bacterium]HPT41419.1 HAD hydrolase family protein [Candidatus Gastranaerophilaceae bacterium]
MSLKIPKTVKMVISDFDGVITDGGIYIDQNANISRKLNFKDIMAISLLKKAGIEVAFISGEKNSAIELISKKFSLKEVHQGIRIKIDVIKSIVERNGLKQSEFLYIGDDINDIESLNYSSIKITVPNAVDAVKKVKDIQVTTNLGGSGAFREVADCLLSD